MSPPIVGLLGVVVLLVLMFLRLPIAFCFGIVGTAGLVYLVNIKAGLVFLGLYPYSWGTYYVLMCIPLFILLGHFVTQAGIGSDLFDTAHKWLGRLPGGVAMATMAGGAALGACMGSSIAATATLGKVALPEMKKLNYSDALSSGTVACAGTLAVMIPPSALFVLYSAITEAPLEKLFLAGIFPGILMSLLCMLTIYLWVKRNPEIAPQAPGFSWKERLISLRGVGGVLVLFAVIMGGIYAGIFTATEAAGAGAFAAFLLQIARRKMKLKDLFVALEESVLTTATLLIIVICAVIFAAFVTRSTLPILIGDVLGRLPIPASGIVAIILVIYIPLGMLLEAASMLLLTLPIFIPILESLGFNMVLFGVLVVAMSQVGMIAPPVAETCYVVKGVAPDIDLADIYRGSIPFLITLFVSAIILLAFPQISLFIPTHM